ncbi:MAG: hypothetical protein A2049_09605 [Elusimicrobia bacterium GWA2_62_23]|nr:MAG: hypothetical protein A2049_09605 [Elusimicrobia bacterium GWA2_62_23]
MICGTEFTSVHFFLLVAAVVLAGAGLSYYFSYLRRKKLEELASSMGLLFGKEGPDNSFLAATGLELFRLGRSHNASNLIQLATPAGELWFFDYSYTTGSGKNRTVHAFTVGLVKSAKVQMPAFELKPENLMYKFGEIIGFKDIDLPAFPVFSDKYRLTGSDEAAVHMFFTPERAAWFERNLGLWMQGAGSYAVVFKREGTLPADAWQGFMEEVKILAAEVLK